MGKKEIIKTKILENINALDIAGYLREEVEKALEYFHYYKLNNILKNIDFLDDYLLYLDQKNTKQINDLYCEITEDIDIGAHDPKYYLSDNGLQIVGDKKLRQKIAGNDYNFVSVMQGIKGFLLLTIDEFCNASPVRLSIDQIVWNKEFVRVEE